MAQYPYDDLDDSDVLKTYLGSFWSQQFVAQEDLAAFLNARAITGRSVEDSVTTLTKSISRLDAPVYKNKRYEKITFTVADATDCTYAATTGKEPRKFLTYPIDSKYKSINVLVQNPWGEDVLINGADFLFENNTITFFQDYSDGNDSFDLWAVYPDIDDDLVWKHAGYLVSQTGTSSEKYKKLVNSIADASINGPSYEALCEALSAWVDTPRVKEDGEIVEVITEDTYNKFVITDKNVYKLDKREIPLNAVGDTLVKGAWIASTVKILAPGFKNLPVYIDEIQIDGNYLHSSIPGILTFYNTTTALNVTTNVSGFTKITWNMPDIDGTSSPTTFFDLMHSNGVANSKTLANYLDTRPSGQSSQPTAANLPATINPADFLLNSILRNLFYIVIVEDTTTVTENLTLSDFSFIRSIVPPEIGYLAVGVERSLMTLEIFFCTPPNCPSYDEWHYDEFTLLTPQITDELILVPKGGGICGQNTVRNTLLSGLSMPNTEVTGAGESITIKASPGLTSGAGGSIIVQPGAGVSDVDGTIVIKAATNTSGTDLAQFKTSTNTLLGRILDGGGYVHQTTLTTVNANTNNLALNENLFQRVNCTGSYDLTGIGLTLTEKDGLHMYLYNVGAGNLKLKHNSSSSSVGNRFYVNKELADPDPDLTLATNDYVLLIYDNTDNGSGNAGWRVG